MENWPAELLRLMVPKLVLISVPTPEMTPLFVRFIKPWLLKLPPKDSVPLPVKSRTPIFSRITLAFVPKLLPAPSESVDVVSVGNCQTLLEPEVSEAAPLTESAPAIALL
jgi:hypothetical protein